MSATRIAWATHTANPAGGCSEARLSDGRMDPACRHCYARLMSARVAAMGASQGRTTVHDGVSQRVNGGAVWTGEFRWDRDLLRRHFAEMRPGSRTFLGSMTDLWHPDHDPGLLIALAEEIRGLATRTTWDVGTNVVQVAVVITLTKRADRLLAWQREHFPTGLPPWHWAGVTAGCQQSADERVPVLLQVKMHGPRVLSVEPMTGPVNLTDVHNPAVGCGWGEDTTGCTNNHFNALDGTDRCDHGYWAGGGHERLGWVIAGCESRNGKPGAPMDLAWVRALRDQCAAAGVPFFLKQSAIDGRVVELPELDGRTWDQLPETNR